MKTLIALGGAASVWTDYAAARALAEGARIGAVNDAIGAYWGTVDIAASLHPEKMKGWLRDAEVGVTVCPQGRQGFTPDKTIPEMWSGSSGLYLVQVALYDFGYDRVICCGIPMNPDPHFFDAKPWSDAHKYHRGWRHAIAEDDVRSRVRSMSGWTSECLGKPTRDWLTG